MIRELDSKELDQVAGGNGVVIAIGAVLYIGSGVTFNVNSKGEWSVDWSGDRAADNTAKVLEALLPYKGSIMKGGSEQAKKMEAAERRNFRDRTGGFSGGGAFSGSLAGYKSQNIGITNIIPV